VLVLGGAVPTSITVQDSLGQHVIYWQESLNTAELFDPTSGTFSQTGSLGTARTAHTATLLKDGTVLVIGGLDYAARVGVVYETALTSSELFDSTKGTFAPAASMATPRAEHSATLRSDGTILVAGGKSVLPRTSQVLFLEQSLDTAELLDPMSKAFMQTGSMETPRSGHTATLLQDGRVLVTGGADFTVQSGTQTQRCSHRRNCSSSLMVKASQHLQQFINYMNNEHHVQPNLPYDSPVISAATAQGHCPAGSQ
jgi:hypothetical protein